MTSINDDIDLDIAVSDAEVSDPISCTLLRLVNTIENHGAWRTIMRRGLGSEGRWWFKFGHLSIPPADKESMSVPYR